MRVFSSIALAASVASFTSAATANASTSVGTYVASTVKSAIASDASAVIKAFSATLPQDVLDAVNTALNLTVLQQLSGTTNASQLDTLSSMVSKKLAAVEETAHEGITNTSTFLGAAQGANYTDLRQCIAEVVAHAGTESGQRCLTMNNTAAVSDVKAIFAAMIDQYSFQLPMNTILALQSSVSKFLSNSSLLPAAQELIKDVQASTLSVAATTNADYVDALLAAEACFFDALSQPVYTQAYEYQCDAGTLNDTDSTLDNVQDIYKATVNQYAGVLPPEIVEDIQAIGTAYLSPNISTADNETRNDINAAVLSVVASTSGNTATLTYQLLDCLDLVLIPGAGNASTQASCLSSPSGVAATKLNIVYGYLQQFYGVLPPKLILDLKDKILPTLGNSTSSSAKKTKANLDALFTASGAGPAYVSCFETFETCVVDAVGNANASSTCTLGSSCTTVPFQTAIVDTTSPYAAAVAAIDKAQKKGKSKETIRASAYVAAASAAKVQAKAVKANTAITKKSTKSTKSTTKTPSKKTAAKASAKKTTTKSKSKSVSAKAGSLRTTKQTKAAPQSKAKSATLQANKNEHKKHTHLHFSHKSGKMSKQPSHKTAVKKVASILSGTCS